MTMISAVVEPNGWVLAVTYPGTVTPGAWEFSGADRTNGRFLDWGVDQYPLTPEGTPKVTLAVTSPGFSRSGGEAVADDRHRTLVCTKAYRRPDPLNSQISQTDNGDGTVTDRFALSDLVYSTDTVGDITLLDGWRVGYTSGTAAVVNNSTRLVEDHLPISRWVVPPYTIVEGTVGSPNHIARVERVIAAFHPANDGADLHHAVAAVRFMATDGTTAKYQWATAPSTSPLHGDNLRCWGADFDLTGLNAGMITIHAEEYPWIGLSRATGTMTADGHNTSITGALSDDWATPLSIFYDPVGARYGDRKRYVFIDVTSPNVANTNTGTNDAGAVVFHTTLAAARSAALSTKPQSYTVALQAARIFLDANPSFNLPVANGVSQGGTRSIDFWEFTLTDGQVHVIGPGTTGTGAIVDGKEGLAILQGDPDAEDPRTTTILRSGTAAVSNQNRRQWWRNFRLELGQATLFSGFGAFALHDRLTVRGKPGFETGTNGFWVSAGEVRHVVQCDAASYGSQPGGQLVRNSTRTRQMPNTFVAAVSVTINTEAGTTRSTPAFTPALNAQDALAWNCRVFGWEGGFYDFSPSGGQTGGSGLFGAQLTGRRFAVVNSLYEGVAGGAALQVGENVYTDMRNTIWENTAVIGARMNMHNQSPYPFTASGTTVTAGIIGHGLSVSDSITVAGFAVAAYNGTFTVSAVLDANRFRYVAASSPAALAGTQYVGATVTRNSDSAVFPVVRQNNQHIGNRFRGLLVDRNGSKQDDWEADGNMIGSHEFLYGVGQYATFRANRGIASPANWQLAWDGLGSETDTLYGYETDPADYEEWWGVVADNTLVGPGAGSGNGDYRPSAAKSSRLIGKGAVCSIDRDLAGATRGLTYSAGPYEVTTSELPVQLAAYSAFHLQLAEDAGIEWSTAVASDNCLHHMESDGSVMAVPGGGAPQPGQSRLIKVGSEPRVARVAPE